MSDDIVTRLRNIYTMGQMGVVHEAADEIELIRADIDYLRTSKDRWAKLAKRMFDAHGHYAGEESWCDAYMSDTAECDCGYQQLKEEYKKAVNDVPV